MAFVGRKRELAALEKLYATDAFQMPVVYGRRPRRQDKFNCKIRRR